MAYPDAEALLESLQELNLAPDSPSNAILERRVKAAANQWEKDVDWRPFLSDGIESTRTFHEAENGFVDFHGGLLSLTSATAGGRGIAAEVDFRLTDWCEVAEGLFLLRCAALPIVVTGVWGRVSELPPEVEEAILAKAALSYVPQAQGGTGGALQKDKAGPVEYQYDTSSGRSTPALLQANYDDQLSAWKRVGVV